MDNKADKNHGTKMYESNKLTEQLKTENRLKAEQAKNRLRSR